MRQWPLDSAQGQHPGRMLTSGEIRKKHVPATAGRPSYAKASAGRPHPDGAARGGGAEESTG